MSDSLHRRALSAKLAELLPGQLVTVSDAANYEGMSALSVRYVCPDCKSVILVELEVVTAQIPLLVDHPRIICRLVEDQIIQQHP